MGLLIGQPWQIKTITTKTPPASADVPADKQASYTITFAPDGTFTAQADCNQIAGTYTTAAPAASPSASPTASPSGTFDPTAPSGDLTIVPGPTTAAACPPGSFGDFFVFALGKSKSYSIDATNMLTITLNDEGTLVLQVPPTP